jgi:DNA-binding LacI/PurR family transcriptional regulator
MLRNNTRRGLSRHDVRSRLRELALQKGPSAKLPTQSELCAQIGTTTSTLDEALRDLEAANIIYRRQGSGIFVSPKIGYKSVAVMFSHGASDLSLISPFWGMFQDLLFRGALERSPAKEHEYSFHLLPFGISRESSAGRRAFEELVLSGNLDGILSVMPDEPLQALMANSGVPVVGYAMGPAVGWGVGFDSIQMFRVAAEQLAGQGCRRIMLMPAPNVVEATYVKIVELCDLMDTPVTLYPQTFCTAVHEKRYNSQQIGYQAVMQLFGSQDGPRPDGLIVLDDMVTDGAIKALGKLDIRPGRDVMIATHGNTGSPILWGWDDQLIIIESDAAKMVATMFEILDAVLGGNPPARETRLLPWSIRVHGKLVKTA